jgi:L-lactate dehydrogenase (cytochrome)
MTAATIGDYRALAQQRIPRFLFDYIDGGAFHERTLGWNVEALQNVKLRQRVLRDVSAQDLSTEFFGRKFAMPVALAPVGLAGLTARRGEVQAARAAEAAGVAFCLSTVSACSYEEVADTVQQPIWFQLYMVRDREFMRDLLARVAGRGTNTLVFTVDLPLPGPRYRDARTGLAGGSSLSGRMKRAHQILARPGWAWDVGVHGRPHTFGNLAPLVGEKAKLGNFLSWLGRNFDLTTDWRMLDFLRDNWKGQIVLKGILDAEDAAIAASHGVDGIVVSNHGGRQLDGAPATAEALPAIAEAVGDKLTVLADGGVRSGLDVLRMLALGAKGVMLGRAWAYALAGGGGASTVSEIGPQVLVNPR